MLRLSLRDPAARRHGAGRGPARGQGRKRRLSRCRPRPNAAATRSSIKVALAVPGREGRQYVARARRRNAARHRVRGRGDRRHRTTVRRRERRIPARAISSSRVNGQKIEKTARSRARRRASRAGTGGSPSCAAASRSRRRSADERQAPRAWANLFAAAGLEQDAPRPLADRLRPRTLAEVVGQDHLLGPDGALTRMLETRSLGSMIFWGPPGTGKTTVARLLARCDRARISSRFPRCSPASPT